MKYLGKDDSGNYEQIDLDVEFPTGPTVINTIVNGTPTPTIVESGNVIVRLSHGGWPIVFTKEAFEASFVKLEE
jgi:hypothetical protein